MIIFQPTQTLMKLFGYLFTYSQSGWYIAYNYLVYAFSASIIIPISAYFFANIGNVSVIAETISLCSGEVNAMIKGLVYIRNREKVRQLLLALQRNVDYKESLGRLRHYTSLNKQATFLSRINIAWMTNSICSICLGPALLVLYHALWVGDLQPEMWRQPVGLRFPFDISRSPAYEAVYVWCFVAITCIGYTIAMTDCIFMGVCTQVIACQRDLQDMLGEVDEGCGEVGDVMRYSEADERRIEKRLVECVRFHYDILGYVRDLGAISSPIIFAQFILSVLQMGTLAFQIQVGQNITIDRHIANVVTGIVALTELLIYCYYGNEVTVQGVRVAEAAYAAPWYRMSGAKRRYLYAMQMRGQRPNVFMGLKMVNCSLASYTSVLNMVGSSLALLRSVV